MAKPVGAQCNLACSYCYYSESGNPEAIPDGTRMSEALLETFVRRYIEASPGPVVPFTWHGGEPALAGLDFYRRATEFQKRWLPKGWSCWNNLQTNGVLLDDRWCEFLASEHFDVGLSLDGTEWLHDGVRKDRAGNGTYSRAVAAVRRLRAHGVRPDLLCTVTAATAKEPAAVYRALRNLDTGWIQFIPIVRRGADGAPTSDSVSGGDYGDFLCAVFDEWIDADLGRLDVQLFAETMLVLAGGEANLCWMAPSCGRALVVERDGGVYACDHFVSPEYRLGDVESAPLAALVDSPAQRRFGAAKRAALPADCRACRWLRLCNGGCPKDRTAKTADGESGLNVLCEGFRRFFAHAEAPLGEVVRLGRRGLAPAAVMAELRAARRLRWEGVGRNDPCPCGSGKKAKRCCLTSRP